MLQPGTDEIDARRKRKLVEFLSPGESVLDDRLRETVDATLKEVARCTRDGVRINTFMLDATSYLRDFVERLTQLNRGRAFFTTPETLGNYVLVDFIEQRRAMQRRGPRSA